MGKFSTALRKAAGPVKGVGDAKSDYLDNDDIRPLALKDRTWTHWTYFTFWFSAMSTVGTWYSSSAAQSAGLTMWEAWGTGFAGHVIVAFIAYYNGRPGAIYSVGYPILCRASFGVYGAWWPVFNRGVMAIVWNGVNAVQGGQCVYTMLHAIFPGITKLPNVMGSGSALDSGGLIGFFIFWIATNIFLVLPVPKMKNYVYTKLVVFVISAVAMLAWTLTLAGGLGAVASQPSTVHGSAKAWLIVRFVILGAASSATFASNAADFQRYARRPSDTIWGNVVGFPLAILIVTLIGNLVAASSPRIFGKLVWNPLTMLDMIQAENYSPANRAGCFFIALMFAYSAIFSSIFENSLPAGNDLAALVPRWISVQRGMYLCQIISVIIQPWYLLGSASIFISFLSSYQVFLSAITGVLLANYYLVARGSFKVPDLYTSDKHGAYHYFHGWNIRAYLAYILGIAPNFYGFLHAMGVKANIGVIRFYYFAYPVGIIVSVLVFCAASYLSPPAIHFPIREWHEPRDYIRPEEEIEATTVAGEDLQTASPSNSFPGIDKKGGAGISEVSV